MRPHTSAKWAVLLLAALAAVPVGAADRPYRVQFRGAPEWGLRAELADAADSVELRAHPPPTAELLQRRGALDVPRLQDVLRARGYYAASVTARVEGAPERRRLVFDLSPGPRFRFGEITLEAPGVTLPTRRQLGLRPGEPARAATALEAESLLLQAVRRQGYPFPRLAGREYRAEADAALIHVALRVDPGPRARFGRTRVQGLSALAPSVVLGDLPWSEGERYDPDRVEEARAALVRSGLFSLLAVEPASEVDEAGVLPFTVSARERRQRTVSLSATYKTDEGAGAGAQWEHRNLAGGAERLSLQAQWAERARSGGVVFQRPHVGRPGQDLELSLRAAAAEPDAYESRDVRAGAALDRRWSRRVSSRIGPALRYAEIEQADEEDSYLLVSLPLQLRRSSRDDLLDARSGSLIQLDAEPFYDALAGDVFFLKTTLRGQRYVPLNRTRSWVLAGRAALGALAGSSRHDLPADERYYAGGGASIRGYAYQSVGPLEDEQPEGGRSLFETSAELRWQATRRFGLVAFMDGGTAFESNLPDFEETLRWGAGAGVRYFTPVGPLRVDVGLPLNRRPDVDDDYQVYVSLGQAF